MRQVKLNYFDIFKEWKKGSEIYRDNDKKSVLSTVNIDYKSDIVTYVFKGDDTVISCHKFELRLFYID